jgi:hypothetical protein
MFSSTVSGGWAKSLKKKEPDSTKLLRSRETPMPDDAELEEPQQEPSKSGAPAQPAKRRSETMAAPPPQNEKQKLMTAVFAFLFGVTLVALVGVLGVQLFKQQPAAVMRITSQPPGASVFWNGEPLKDKTPCTLPAAAAGSYWLEVSLEGHEVYRAKIEVPSHGEREMAVVLKPAK